MSPLHILHVFPTFEVGGTQVRMAGIMNALGGEARHSIYAVDGNLDAAGRIDKRIPFSLLPPLPGAGTAGYPLAMRKLVKQTAPDLLVTYNWGAIDAVIGCCIDPPCPIIHNECGFGDDEAVAMKRRRVWTRRLVLPRIEATVVVSSVLHRVAQQEFGLAEDQVRLIRTGVRLDRFRPGFNAGARARIGASESTVVFGYAGGLREEKNVRLLVEAFGAASFKDAKLILIGDGPERAELERIAPPGVVFLGRTEEVAGWLNACDVFLLSSNTEQTSNALLEAMAAGLPVVCTDVGDNREILGEHQAEGVVTRGDGQSFRAAMERFAAGRDLRRETGAANRRRCEERFSFDRMVAEYRDLYLSATAPKVLTLSIVFPNPREPAHGIFVRNRMQHVARLARIKVIAPVGLIDYSVPKGQWLASRDVVKRRRDEALDIIHPRWMYPPFGTPVNAVCLAGRVFITALLMRRRFRFDLIDSHFGFPDGSAAAMLAAVFRKPFLVTLRGNEDNFGAKRGHRRMMGWALRRAARVIAVSEHLRLFAVSLGVDPARTKTIPNGIEIEKFYPRERAECRAKHGIPADELTILSAGALVERKGHHRIVEALKVLRDKGIGASLLIAGGTGREGLFEDRIRSRIAELGLSDHVRMAGRVDQATMAELMSAADVFCLASSHEGWPNVVHEAQGCGAPVVANGVGGVPDMIPSEEYGYVVPPLDGEALAAALEKALNREWDRGKISAWARARSWDQVAVEVYEQMKLALEERKRA